MSNENRSLQHIERIEICDVEQKLADTLGNKFGLRFMEYRNNWYKTLDYANSSYVPNYPLTVGVELLNKCNFTCSMCYTTKYKGPKIVIEEETVDKIFKGFGRHEMPSIMFGMGEEPLLYKNFRNIIDLSINAGIMDIFVFTNGLLLNEEMSNFLVDRGISRVYISLDAATPETFLKIRGKNELERVEKNIASLLRIRAEKKAELPIVRVSFCVQPDNAHEKYSFIKKWEKVVDHIDFQTMLNFSAVDEMAEIAEEKRMEPVLTPNVPNPQCPQPFYMATVWANGDVSPCCTFHGKNIPIGNIRENSLGEIWNGTKANEIRQQFLKGEINIICQECLSNRESHSTTDKQKDSLQSQSAQVAK